MAKRFIDTGLFDDEWFSELKLQSKIFWLYFITKCDHAGFLKYNERLIKFQTGVQDLPETLKDFPNRIVRVTEQYLFSPKFVQYQYPGFPNCNFKAATSAIKIMQQNGIDINSYLTVPELLPNSYGNGNCNGTSNSISKEERVLENIDGFEDVWVKWLDYKKKEFKEGYRNVQTEQQAFNNLLKLSLNDPALAIEVVDQSINNRWKGLFELKTQRNDSTNRPNKSEERINAIANAGSSIDFSRV